MSNTLDLKDQQPGVLAAEPVVAEPVDEVPEATLAAADLLDATNFSTSAAWTAHHPLTGAARRRHTMLAVGIAAAGLLISLWQRSPSAFIVLLIGAGVLELRQHMSKPTSVTVDHRGIEIDEQRYDHAAFTSFHIHRMPDDTLELSLKSEQPYLPHLRLPLGQQDPHELHAVLTQYIPEGTHKIPITDYFIRKPR